VEQDVSSRVQESARAGKPSAGGRAGGATGGMALSRGSRAAALRGKPYAQQVAALSPRGEARAHDGMRRGGGAAGMAEAGKAPGDTRRDAADTALAKGPQSYADTDTLTPEMLEFLSQPHAIANYQPPTGLGLFDARYDNAAQELVVTVKCAFRFLPSQDVTDPDKAAEGWTEASKAEWRKGFMDIVDQRWSGQHAFQCAGPGLERLRATVRVEVVEAEKDWHFRLDVTRIPKGAWAGSSISAHRGSRTEANFGTLDSEDLAPAAKGGSEGQLGAVHEFGHMIGLDDEYGSGKGISHRTLVQDALGREIEKGSSDDVMSLANRVQPQHYVTFLEALKKATGIDDWVVAA
jgi:hypothetical protein